MQGWDPSAGTSRLWSAPRSAWQPPFPPRRKVFISYHHDDQYEANQFILDFGAPSGVFIRRILGLMPEDIIDSADTDYVMGRIRKEFLHDSTVTIVLIGRCTWARRYVDWEIQASLRQGVATAPNGLLGIVLPSAANRPRAPERLGLNLQGSDGQAGYARWYYYTWNPFELRGWIEDAYWARTSRAELILNPRDRFSYNRTC